MYNYLSRPNQLLNPSIDVSILVSYIRKVQLVGIRFEQPEALLAECIGFNMHIENIRRLCCIKNQIGRLFDAVSWPCGKPGG